MKIQKKLIGDESERAVSPVIGVILMVAVTVILAAVIAAFVLDIGDPSQPVQGSIGVEETDTDDIVVTIENAQSLDDIQVTGCSNLASTSDPFSLTESTGVSSPFTEGDLLVGEKATIDGDDNSLIDSSDNFQSSSGCAGEELTFVGHYDGSEEILTQFNYDGS